MTLPLPLDGTTLVTGPSNVGKTRLTARALDTWVEGADIESTGVESEGSEGVGSEGVVVFEFAPEFECDGRLLGGRLSRFTTIPAGAWHGILDAHAPRAESETVAEAKRLAGSNATRAARLFEAAPSNPRAVFVNDATIPFQHEQGDPEWLVEYCRRADVAVLNAFESDEFGTDDPISRRERDALEHLKRGSDRTVRLE
ncbi:hypothetical protein [Haladaptatus sp. NG-SE-30]